ncbi:geranylgeranyl reductase family protein [Halorubrum lacusprofundi]|jgi:geranylgeranyl reductase family protein|uniref:Geranylgeranyl reductase n=1 Tax=Halorubrum lacusprofundi (strain ATCC 49239 / DSM 5036 / JCM 8891 / ACAM 34) TaxID=416348 RepID=B9LNF2_HALLT|nr:geranylgeranyl reductase family protein [Halorubrum lacusprofundi]ACM56890.1 geranylgeranyl reductase [Halorubrum lacusprofundi ATCC 49239]MCG1006523.1 geranylgeranyl reductase family protein [Halorubrum lacusprofundi]
MHDFVVVGAGPPGSRFARRAAAAGRDVVVFEKGSIGTPLACSGHVSDDVWEYVPDDARDELLQNRVYGARFHVGGPGSKAYPFYKSEPVSNVIDRVGLDRTLADCAREAGADVRENHTVVGVDERDDRVVVEVRTPAGDVETVEARMVAGCDGPTSRVRRSLGLPEPDELLHGVLAFDEAPDDGDLVDVHLTAPTFFAWRIPRGDAGVEYGLAAPPSDDVSAMFDRLTDAYDVTTDHFCSGAIPVGPPERVTTDRAFLIGDAAAQTKPFTGGGILYGMTAADVAAEVIDPRDPATLADYESGWRDAIGTEIRLGSAIRRCYSLPEPVQRTGLWALSGEIGVHMDRPSSFFSPAHLKKLFSRSNRENAPR